MLELCTGLAIQISEKRLPYEKRARDSQQVPRRGVRFLDDSFLIRHQIRIRGQLEERVVSLALQLELAVRLDQRLML
jgi:hypothetical protein